VEEIERVKSFFSREGSGKIAITGLGTLAGSWGNRYRGKPK